MASLRTRLEEAARKVKARMPDAARGLIDRVETAYRGARTAAPAPTPPDPAPAPTTPPPARAINWELRSPAELVAHIESHYHAGLRRDLPSLVEAAQTVERAHATHAAVPRGLAAILESLASDLEGHMQKEERMLFPALRTGARGGSLDMPIRMMEREHEDHADALERIRQVTHELEAPEDADTAWRALYARLATLETDLRQHVYLEDHVLFARALGAQEW